jgi:ATPase subunit of ABC transporter with duplicated ATPase domains
MGTTIIETFQKVSRVELEQEMLQERAKYEQTKFHFLLTRHEPWIFSASALSNASNLLLLDEPTNHLDAENRRSLIRKLQNFSGIFIVATQDTEILRNCVDILWHIDCGKVVVFNGKYDDYMRQKQIKYNFLLKQKNGLDRQKAETHQSLMKQQERITKSKASVHKKVENKT